MKIIRFMPIAALATLAFSCQNGGTLSESSTPTDSLMYYLGELNAGDYLREAERDTTMKENASKKAYLDGVKAGLSIMRDSDETFNKGVMMGFQMAGQIISFSKQNEVTIDKGMYIGSLGRALAADTMPALGTAQTEFRRLLNQIQMEKEQRDNASAQESLKQAAESAGLPKMGDDLYGKVTSTTDGEELKNGDVVTSDVKITLLDGKDVSLPIASPGTIGNLRNFPGIISNAMTKLKSGESGEFMTSAHALTSGHAQQLGLTPTDVVKITMTVTLVPQEEKAEDKK